MSVQKERGSRRQAWGSLTGCSNMFLLPHTTTAWPRLGICLACPNNPPNDTGSLPQLSAPPASGPWPDLGFYGLDSIPQIFLCPLLTSRPFKDPINKYINLITSIEGKLCRSWPTPILPLPFQECITVYDGHQVYGHVVFSSTYIYILFSILNNKCDPLKSCSSLLFYRQAQLG